MVAEAWGSAGPPHPVARPFVMPMRLFVAAALLLLGLSAVPNASAVTVPEVPLLDATAAEISLLPCNVVAGDWDRDGENENWNVCATPPCGCACPVVGAGVTIEAADQERGAWVATSGCQTGFATMNDDADGGSPVKPFVWTWGLDIVTTS